jgi:hypothetical protein
MRGLTSLFGMGRGEHPRQNHHKKVIRRANKNKLHIGISCKNKTILFSEENIKNKAYGQLVLLGFDVTTLIPVAYQRHSL